MDSLCDIVRKAVSQLSMVVRPLHEQDERIMHQINPSISLADNLARLSARTALIQPQMEAISHHKELVKAATSRGEPAGKTEELMTVFFHLVKTLQSDCHQIQQDTQAWIDLLNTLDAVHERKQDLEREEKKLADQILELRVKDDRRKASLRFAWHAMSEEFKSNQPKEDSSAPAGSSRDAG